MILYFLSEGRRSSWCGRCLTSRSEPNALGPLSVQGRTVALGACSASGLQKRRPEIVRRPSAIPT